MSTTRSPDPKAPAIRPPYGWNRPPTDLVVVAHGSARFASGTAATRAHVERLRQRGLFRSVQAGFLFGSPTIEEALAATDSSTVDLVPFLMSDGVYTREVIPGRLGLTGADRMRYALPVGTHPGVADILADRAGDLCRSASLATSDATLVLVGHGSPRDRSSASATYACARQLRQAAQFGQVRVAFLDEPPSVVDVLGETDPGHVVVAGFFADEGRHAGNDVRAAIGFGPGGSNRRRAEGRLLAYTGAIGTDPAIADIIVARAKELAELDPALRRSA